MPTELNKDEESNEGLAHLSFCGGEYNKTRGVIRFNTISNHSQVLVQCLLNLGLPKHHLFTTILSSCLNHTLIQSVIEFSLQQSVKQSASHSLAPLSHLYFALIYAWSLLTVMCCSKKINAHHLPLNARLIDPIMQAMMHRCRQQQHAVHESLNYCQACLIELLLCAMSVHGNCIMAAYDSKQVTKLLFTTWSPFATQLMHVMHAHRMIEAIAKSLSSLLHSIHSRLPWQLSRDLLLLHTICTQYWQESREQLFKYTCKLSVRRVPKNSYCSITTIDLIVEENLFFRINVCGSCGMIFKYRQNLMPHLLRFNHKQAELSQSILDMSAEKEHQLLIDSRIVSALLAQIDFTALAQQQRQKSLLFKSQLKAIEDILESKGIILTEQQRICLQSHSLVTFDCETLLMPSMKGLALAAKSCDSKAIATRGLHAKSVHRIYLIATRAWLSVRAQTSSDTDIVDYFWRKTANDSTYMYDFVKSLATKAHTHFANMLFAGGVLKLLLEPLVHEIENGRHNNFRRQTCIFAINKIVEHCQQLVVIGFNSSRFDLRCCRTDGLLAYLVKYHFEQEALRPYEHLPFWRYVRSSQPKINDVLRTLGRDGGYLSIETPLLKFRDFIAYMVNSGSLRQLSVELLGKDLKSHFPYLACSRLEQLHDPVPRRDSLLWGDDMQESRHPFPNTPTGDSEWNEFSQMMQDNHIDTLYDLAKYYCAQDTKVQHLLAIEFKSRMHDVMNVGNIYHTYVSLPSLAFNEMIRSAEHLATDLHYLKAPTTTNTVLGNQARIFLPPVELAILIERFKSGGMADTRVRFANVDPYAYDRILFEGDTKADDDYLDAFCYAPYTPLAKRLPPADSKLLQRPLGDTRPEYSVINPHEGGKHTFACIESYDVSSSYSAALCAEMPCGVPIYRSAEDNFRPKMMSDSLHESQVWLMYMSYKLGTFIHMASNSAERQIYIPSLGQYYRVDGYYEKDGKKVVLEFEECYLVPADYDTSAEAVQSMPKQMAKVSSHGGCRRHLELRPDLAQLPPPYSASKTAASEHARTQERRQNIIQAGYQYVQQWSCDWEQQKRQSVEVQRFVASFQVHIDLLQREMSQQEMLEAIIDGQVRGFIEASVDLPSQELRNRYDALPAVIRVVNVHEELLSPFSQQYAKRMGLKMGANGKRLLVATHTASYILLTDETVCFLHEQQYAVRVLAVWQYAKLPLFRDFIYRNIDARNLAKLNKQQILDQIWKLCSNSAYGALLLRVDKYGTTRYYCSMSEAEQATRQPNAVDLIACGIPGCTSTTAQIDQRSPAGTFTGQLIEVKRGNKVGQGKQLRPTHLGFCVLATGKLNLLRLPYLLFRHCDQSTFSLISTDTDCCVIGTSARSFTRCCPPATRAEFTRKLSAIMVARHEEKNKRENLGKFNGEIRSYVSRMYSLDVKQKIYFAPDGSVLKMSMRSVPLGRRNDGNLSIVLNESLLSALVTGNIDKLPLIEGHSIRTVSRQIEQQLSSLEMLNEPLLHYQLSEGGCRQLKESIVASTLTMKQSLTGFATKRYLHSCGVHTWSYDRELGIELPDGTNRSGIVSVSDQVVDDALKQFTGNFAID